jgi:hypothetical protein
MSKADYDYFSDFTAHFIRQFPPVAVDGAYYDLPDTTVYHTHTRPLAAKGRLEVNVVTPEAADAFEWTTEITLNDKATGRFIHLIIRRDGSVVETYGKTVIELTPARSTELHTIFSAIS